MISKEQSKILRLIFFISWLYPFNSFGYLGFELWAMAWIVRWRIFFSNFEMEKLKFWAPVKNQDLNKICKPLTMMALIWFYIQVHRKKIFSIFPSPAGMSLFPPRESLVSDIQAGDGNIEKLFLRWIVHLQYARYTISIYLEWHFKTEGVCNKRL